MLTVLTQTAPKRPSPSSGEAEGLVARGRQTEPGTRYQPPAGSEVYDHGRRALEAAGVIFRLRWPGRAAAQAATKKRLAALSARWGAVVIFGRAFGLRVGRRASPSRCGQIRCIKKASGDNRQPALNVRYFS